MPTPVRVVLVGCGSFACVAHIPALRRLEREGRIRLVGLCSRSEASVARASHLYARQDLKHYLSLEEVAEDREVDLVDLTLPIDIMPDAIKLFLSAGKRVISEKPCSPSVATGIELIEHHARLDQPVLWAVAENWRFKKTTQMVEGLVASGALGEIRFADFTYLAFQRPDNLRWRGSPGYAGGYLLDSGVHFIALLRKIVGEIEEVSASVSQRLPYLPPADSVTAILAFASGAEGAYRLSFAAPSPAGDQGLRLIGAKGTLLAGFHRFGKRDFRAQLDTGPDQRRKALHSGHGRSLRPGRRLRDPFPLHRRRPTRRTIGQRSGPSPAGRRRSRGHARVEPAQAAGEAGRASSAGSCSTGYSRTQIVKTFGDSLSFQPQKVVECAHVEDVSNAVAAGGRSRPSMWCNFRV